MDAEEYRKLKARFRRLMKRYRNPDLVEDVLHQYILARLEGRCEKQDIRYFIIDRIRERAGRTDVKSKPKFVSLDKIQLAGADPRNHDAIYQEPFAKQMLFDLVEKLKNSRHRDLVKLYYLEGRSLNDTAYIMGVTKSRVSQLCKQLIEKAREIYGLDRGLDGRRPGGMEKGDSLPDPAEGEIIH